MNKGTKYTIAFGVGYVIVKWTLIVLVGGALYKSGYWSNWFLLAIPVIGFTVFMIKRKNKENKNQENNVDY
jgi:general stress protein CsbA